MLKTFIAKCICVLQDDRITGMTQLYNVDEDLTQCIGAHCVCFSEYHYSDNPLPSTVMCVASRDALDHGKVFIHMYNFVNITVQNSNYYTENAQNFNSCVKLML